MPRPPRFRAIAAAVVTAVAAALAAAPAGAQTATAPVLLSGPADGARLASGTAPPLRARGVPGDTALELRVSHSPQALDACGRIGPDVTSAPGVAVAGDLTLFDFPTAGWFDTPGTYHWQVSGAAPDGTCFATEARRLALVAATPASPALGALPVLSTERIPRSIGSSNGTSFLIRTGGVPPGVSKTRFLTLVRNSARRWRLHSLGRRPGRPVFGNGRSEVGFSTAQVPPGALGVTIFGRHGERDLILRADIRWDAGPAHPDRRHVDLETVLLHELGHVAGNRFHVPRGCRDTPMVVGLATGEWWRSTTDFSYRACNRGG